MRPTADDVIRELASRQHGLMGRWQLRSRGVDSAAVGRRVRNGTLIVRSKRVLQVAGTQPTGRSTVMAGVLDGGPGAVLSHGSAAAMWRVPGFMIEPVEITGRRATVCPRTRDLAVVHVPRLLMDRHWVEVDGVRLTTPTRTIFDLAGSPWMHPAKVERVLDSLWARQRVSAASLQRMLSDLACRGRAGIVLMRALLDARGPRYRPPESNAEARFQYLVRSWGYHGFERQVDAGDEARWIGRVDFIDRARRLVVEVNPALYHSALTDLTEDERRHAALIDAGFEVLVVVDDDLFHDPASLRERLSAVIVRQRSALRSGDSIVRIPNR
jgi:very-short-patch-repair endonuclease